MAPFLVIFFRLPVYIVAGSTLLATAITSFAGVCAFSLLSVWNPQAGAFPDLLLGLDIGLGGVLGMYFGARCQKHVPAAVIKTMLALVLVGMGTRYLTGWLF